MFDLNILIALISFYFVMYVTPGPNNHAAFHWGMIRQFSPEYYLIIPR